MYYMHGDNAVRYETDNAIDGTAVKWTAHVAPIVKLESESENLYVLDPSLSRTPVIKFAYDTYFGGQITSSRICNSNPNYLREDCSDLPGDMTNYESKRAKNELKVQTERLLNELVF